MSQGFLIFPDIHPILVGAGCLALGYVYGRHCRSAGLELREDGVPLASDDVCCAQSQSNTYFDDLQHPCNCCVSAPAEMDAMAAGGRGKKKGRSKLTRCPYLDAAEGFEQAERSTKRDLTHRMEKREYADGEVHGMRLHDSSRPYFLMLEEERLLQAKTPCKKQKGTPVVKESLVDCPLKGKAEIDFDHRLNHHEPSDDPAAAAAAAATTTTTTTTTACVPWSREVLHRRIEYFNNVSETTADSSGRSDESRKLRLIKKKFLKVAQGEDYNSISTTASNNSSTAAATAAAAAAVVVRSGSTSGLVQLATLDRQQAADDANSGHENNISPLDSPHRMSGGGWNTPNNMALREHLEAPGMALSCFGNSNTADRVMEHASCEAKYDLEQGSEPESTSAVAGSFQSVVAAAAGYEALLNDVSMATQGGSATSRRAMAEEHYGTERCLGRGELREDPAGDEMLKAELFDLLTETDNCTKVSFEEIVTLLEERLQTNLQESKARIAELVREVGSSGEFLEKEGRAIATGEEACSSQSEQDAKATAVHNHVSSSAVASDYYAASSSSTRRPGAGKTLPNFS